MADGQEDRASDAAFLGIGQSLADCRDMSICRSSGAGISRQHASEQLVAAECRRPSGNLLRQSPQIASNQPEGGTCSEVSNELSATQPAAPRFTGVCPQFSISRRKMPATSRQPASDITKSKIPTLRRRGMMPSTLSELLPSIIKARYQQATQQFRD